MGGPIFGRYAMTSTRKRDDGIARKMPSAETVQAHRPKVTIASSNVNPRSRNVNRILSIPVRVSQQEKSGGESAAASYRKKRSMYKPR